MPFPKNIRLLLAILFGIGQMGTAQMLVESNHSAEELVKVVLVGEGENLSIENVRYTGGPRSLGLFNLMMKYNDLIPRGIILSTGDVQEAMGPNDVFNLGMRTSLGRDADLEKLANGKTFDAAILEFDFVPKSDSIAFNFFFASEEYPEYVNKNVNDVFGFFLTHEKSGKKVNLAVLPGTDIPITVDNINAGKNKEYFVTNAEWDHDNILKWKDRKPEGELALTFQYDGLTTLLPAGVKVIPNARYHLKIAIADVGDPYYDSAIFLEAGSFSSLGAGETSPEEKSLSELVSEAFTEKAINEDTAMRVSLQILFDNASFAIQGAQSFDDLAKVVEIMKSDPVATLEVHGHTDDNGSEAYNRQLSLNRAKSVAQYISEQGIPRHRLKWKGFGESRPLDKNIKAANRRVEFVFKSS